MHLCTKEILCCYIQYGKKDYVDYTVIYNTARKIYVGYIQSSHVCMS